MIHLIADMHHNGMRGKAKAFCKTLLNPRLRKLLNFRLKRCPINVAKEKRKMLNVSENQTWRPL
ncbi:hypothetical protein Mapa_011374 [Marchantia paleacea]|nr:hypothetical protein Mapa_011374 [Marchantia paleacea]